MNAEFLSQNYPTKKMNFNFITFLSYQARNSNLRKGDIVPSLFLYSIILHIRLQTTLYWYNVTIAEPFRCFNYYLWTWVMIKDRQVLFSSSAAYIKYLLSSI